MEKASLAAAVGFGILFIYSIFQLIEGSSPGGALIVSIVGLVVTAGNYLAQKKDVS